MADGDRVPLDLEQIGGECLDVAFRYPRRTEIGVNVAWQYVLRLHGSQCFDIAGIRGAGRLDGGELGADVTGEIGVSGLPGPGLWVWEDQVTQLGDNLCFLLTVQGANER